MFESVFRVKDSRQLQARVLVMRIMAAKHLTVSEVASEIGVHRNTITKWLTHEKDVSKKILMRILEYVQAEKGRVEL